MSAASLLHHRRRCGAIIITIAALLPTFGGICPAVSWAQSPADATGISAVEETLVLKHLKPSALVTFLAQGDKAAPPVKPGAKPSFIAPSLLPASIKSVTPDDVFNTVTIQGDPDAIATIRKLALLLDVPAQTVRLNVRIIRYRNAASQKAGGSGVSPLADVEEVASGIVETPSNIPVEVTTYGDRHTFRARLVPHANNTASVTIAADLQMAAPDGTFNTFPLTPSGSRLLRIGNRGLITSAGAGISVASVLPQTAKTADSKAAKPSELTTPETYYLEVTPSLPPAGSDKSTESPAAKT